MSLVLVHREPKKAPVPQGVPVWRTCLREVLFFNDEEQAAAAGDPIVEADAYRLLLEIICGLRSPMLGETQVMGQFKTFLGTLGPNQNPLRKTGQRLLSEARMISEQHLRHLGSRSYGSATRKRVADSERVVVIGTGALAQELMKFLAGEERPIEQWGRRPADEIEVARGVTYRMIGNDLGGRLHLNPGIDLRGRTALIIAAPIPSDVVNRIAALYPNLEKIVDLRAETDLGPLDVAAPVVSLAELFAEIEAARRDSVSHIEAAQAGVLRYTREYELRDELRPFGWEDLCA